MNIIMVCKKKNFRKGSLRMAASVCIAGMGLLAACQPDTKKEGDSLVTDSIVVDIDTLIHACSVTSSYSIDYPTGGPQPLLDSVRTWISRNCGDTYTGDLSDGEQVVNHYAQSICTMAGEDFAEDEGNEFEISYSDEAHITRGYETDKTVTFNFTNYVYTGGAHGNGAYVNNTFRKDNGASLTWDIFREDTKAELQELLLSHLKDYFEVETDDELNEQLLDTDVADLPLPYTQPAFTEKGIQFVYQSYEIAPYSAGKPEGVISYEEARPYLTKEATALLPTAKP